MSERLIVECIGLMRWLWNSKVIGYESEKRSIFLITDFLGTRLCTNISTLENQVFETIDPVG